MMKNAKGGPCGRGRRRIKMLRLEESTLYCKRWCQPPYLGRTDLGKNQGLLCFSDQSDVGIKELLEDSRSKGIFKLEISHLRNEFAFIFKYNCFSLSLLARYQLWEMCYLGFWEFIGSISRLFLSIGFIDLSAENHGRTQIDKSLIGYNLSVHFHVYFLILLFPQQ